MEIKTFEEDKPHLNICKIQQTFLKYGKESYLPLESFLLKSRFVKCKWSAAFVRIVILTEMHNIKYSELFANSLLTLNW